MQARQVSSLAAFPFGHADISIQEHVFKPGFRQRRLCPFRSSCTLVPMATQGHVLSKQPAGTHRCLRRGNIVCFFFPICPVVHPSLSLSNPLDQIKSLGLNGEKLLFQFVSFVFILL